MHFWKVTSVYPERVGWLTAVLGMAFGSEILIVVNIHLFYAYHCLISFPSQHFWCICHTVQLRKASLPAEVHTITKMKFRFQNLAGSSRENVYLEEDVLRW